MTKQEIAAAMKEFAGKIRWIDAAVGRWSEGQESTADLILLASMNRAAIHLQQLAQSVVEKGKEFEDASRKNSEERAKSHPRIEGRRQWIAVGFVDYPSLDRPLDKAKAVRLPGFFDTPSEAMRAACEDTRIASKCCREISQYAPADELEMILPPLIGLSE